MSFLRSLLFASIIGVSHWLLSSAGAIAIPITLPSTLNSPGLVQQTITQPYLPAALPGFKAVFGGSSPSLGVQDGKLSPCPSSPNCVVSQGTVDAEHQIAPIEYEGDRSTAHDNLVKAIATLPRTEIVTDTDDYIRIAATSRLMGFVDDVEFYFPADEAVIHVRSASRLGESDLGVNRDRIETIRAAMQSATPAIAEEA